MPDLWPLLLVLLLLIQFSVSSSILHSEFVCRRPEPMLESDAVRAPQTLSSLALDLAFSTPYKKNLKKTLLSWCLRLLEMFRPHFCICDLWALLEPVQPPQGEGILSACFY